MRRSPETDALGRTVAGGSFIGVGLGGVTMVFVLLSSLSGLSLGNCNLGGFTIPDAPVRDGLGIAVSGDGSLLVTVDSGTGLLDIIRNGRLEEQVPIGGQTTDVALTPDGRRALITDTNVGGSSGIVAVVDLATASVTARIVVGSGPTGVVVSPDGTRAYVADTGYAGPGNVDVLDLTRDTVASSFTVGLQPAGEALSPDGSRLYVVDAALYPSPSQPGSATGNEPGAPSRPEPGDVDVVDT